MEQVCRISECEKPVMVKVHQLCVTHYGRLVRNGDPEIDGAQIRRARKKEREDDMSDRKCRDCKEVKPVSEYYTNKSGWRYLHCKTCHNANRMAKVIQERIDNPKPKKVREPVDRGECTFETCHRPANTKLKDGPEGWYCQTHWMQWYEKKTLSHAKSKKKSYIDEQYRRCTACEEVKPHTAFFLRSKSVRGRPDGRQSNCRKCMGMTSKFNILRRAKRYEEAAEVVEQMPDILKERYSEALRKAIEG